MQERRTLHCLHAREFMHKSRSAHFGIHIQHFDFAFEFSILHWLRLSAAFSGRDPRSKRKVEKRKECRCCWVDLVSSGLPVTIHINTIFLQSHYFANSSHVFSHQKREIWIDLVHSVVPCGALVFSLPFTLLICNPH